MNAIIFLNYMNDNVNTLGLNLSNAGADIQEVVIVKEVGIANAINIGLKQITLRKDLISKENRLTIENFLTFNT